MGGKGNLTRNNVVFFLSEQGEGNSLYYQKTKAGYVEHKKPLLYVMAPKVWLKRCV
jgi:hypothetical protein